MQKMLHFMKYNNAVPIFLGALFLGTTATFAAVNPEVVYTTEETVISIDNTYIADKNLDNYTPEVLISDVTEDDEYYYVEYELTTIALADDIWQDVAQTKVMHVSKDDLGKYKDLGVYVSQQLKQLIDREISLLKETQGFEKAKVTKKIVATQYGGLIGKIMDDTTEELPGYKPVVDEQEQSENTLLTESRENNKTDTYIATAVGAVTQSSQEYTEVQTLAVVQVPNTLSFQILGNNPVHVPLGATYFDLGVMLLSEGRIVDYPVQTLLGDVEMAQIVIDSDEDGEYVITYKAQDTTGNIVEAQRIVLVGDVEVSEPVDDEEVEEEEEDSTTISPAEDTVEETTETEQDVDGADSDTTVQEEEQTEEVEDVTDTEGDLPTEEETEVPTPEEEETEEVPVEEEPEIQVEVETEEEIEEEVDESVPDAPEPAQDEETPIE